MLNRKEDVIKRRMNDLKILLALMDDDQWSRLTYRLAVLTKNESISSLEKPDLEQKERSEQADTTKKELDKLIKNLSDPTYNITRMSLDEVENSYKKYKELLDKKDTGAIWCLVEDIFDKQRELCDKAPKTTEKKDSEDGSMLENVGSAISNAAKKTTEIAKNFFKKAKQENKIKIITNPAIESLNDLKKNNKKFDLVFIDADKENYKNYYDLSLELIGKNDLIIVDNVLWHGEVVNKNSKDKLNSTIKEFNKYINNDKRIENLIMPLGDGLTICRKL